MACEFLPQTLLEKYRIPNQALNEIQPGSHKLYIDLLPHK
jgi:hypothetical protein